MHVIPIWSLIVLLGCLCFGTSLFIGFLLFTPSLSVLSHTNRYYKRALELFPDQSSIHLKYAGFLRHIKRDINGAGEEYFRAVETNPQNADALGNYASFLHGVKQDVGEAAKYYERAVAVDDTHANNLCNYGLFLR